MVAYFYYAPLMLFLCSSYAHAIDKTFPYGQTPDGNVCVSSDYFATPETLLGSWAMIQAVDMDLSKGVLPKWLTSYDVVYGVGTAAIGTELGLPNCATGCNELNGYCFALKFNDKQTAPYYMIFQSVNIAANPNSIDVYMAGGGAGAFPGYCEQFWGQDVANWSSHVQNYQSCNDYFNYENVTSSYVINFNGKTYQAKNTLKSACEFASQTGFNKQNFDSVTVVPVTCPESLTQISGLRLAGNIQSVGSKKILNLSSLSEHAFDESSVIVGTTQMQDCKTPSSGYCNNVQHAMPNYQASISATLTKPILSEQSPKTTYCQEHPGQIGYCSWDKGHSSGSDYCNQNESICKSCGNNPKWCRCDDLKLTGCD